MVLDVEGGARVTFNDARRFGAMDLWPTADLEAHRLLAGLGPEPLGNGFHGRYLAGRLAGRVTPVKAVLIDQRVVAGLGNIYVCEALWRARDLAAAAGAGRDAGGGRGAGGGGAGGARGRAGRRRVELRDYRRADGELGYFQHSFAVYDREGEPCLRPGCGGVIARVVQSGRSSFYCPVCQA